MLRAIYTLGSRLPSSFKDSTKKAYYGFRFEILNLNTIPKSGTQRVKLFLANYIDLLQGGEGNVTYPDMLAKFFPNVRDRYIQYDTPYVAPILTGLPFRDFTHSHSTQFLEFFPGRLMFLYRHPLDQIVSRYHHSLCGFSVQMILRK